MRSVILIGVLLACVGGCSRGGDTPLERFRLTWLEAVNRRDFESLYPLLDAQSQRQIAQQLERLRGLDVPQQKAVIDQLGGQRAPDLESLTPGQYFGLLWARATDGMRPTLTVEATGTESAYMELAIDQGRTQRIRLSVEAGRWVWHLPEQKLHESRIAHP